MKQKQEIFSYLDQVRAAGETNMELAKEYLPAAFGLYQTKADQLFYEWRSQKIENFQGTPHVEWSYPSKDDQ